MRISNYMNAREHSIPGFEPNNNLIRTRLSNYIVLNIMANLSNMLLTNIDAIIVGNFIGNEALSVINIIYPIQLIVGSSATVLCAGIYNYVPAILGKNDPKLLDGTYSAIRLLKRILAAFFTVAQIPFMYIVLKSYGFDPKMESMFWSYVVWIIMSFPFQMYSYVAFDELISIGKVKIFTTISVASAILNMVLDYLLVAILGLGVAGAGMSTGLCLVIEFIVVTYYIRKYTNLRKFKITSFAACKEDMKALLAAGTASALLQLLQGAEGWVMTWSLTKAIGLIATGSMSVLSLWGNIILAFNAAVTQGASPLVGMYHSAGNYRAADRIMNIVMKIVVIVGLIQTALSFFINKGMFLLYGYDEVHDTQKKMLIIYSFYLLFQWCSNGVMTYFSATLQNKLNSTIRVIPVFIRIACAFLFLHLFGGIAVMWAYVIPSIINAVTGLAIYEHQRASRTQRINSENTEYMFISLKKNQEPPLPEKIKNDLMEHNVPKNIANKTAVAIDELTQLVKLKSKRATNIDISLVLGENITLMMWDDGPPSELTSYLNSTSADIFSGFVVRSISQDLRCSRIFDLNYVTVQI